MKLEFEQLLINENAYFFKLKRKLTARDIELIFQECLNDKKAIRKFEPKIRESFIHGPREIAKVSIDVFEFKKRPSFLTRDVKNNFETKYGLFIIIESDEFAAVIRKNVSGIDLLYTLVEKIDYNILVRFLLKEESKYEKLVTSNMNAASNAMQRKTSEADDLQGILSRFGASKQIITSLRVDNKGDKSTVSVNTSRVNSFNIQKDFTPAVLWMVDMMRLIKLALKNPPQSRFIDNFAIPIKFSDIIDELNPKYILLRFGSLKDEIENSQIDKCYHQIGRKKVDPHKEIFEKERLFELTENDEGVFVSGEIKVKVRQKAITISISSFKDIILDFGDGYEVSLNNYINSNNHFLIVFDKYEYVYSRGSVFKDSRLLGDTDNFLSTFVTFDSLKNIDSEKGEKYLPTSTKFKPNSLFSFIEEELALNSNYLICDDMGVEWGDFISIDDDEIVFYHLKHNKLGLSATNLEEVFGQVQKNLGFLQLTDEMINKRKTKWQNIYRFGGINTSIKRMRKYPKGKDTIDDLILYVNHVSSNANVKRKIFVVVDFISKSELAKMLESLKKRKIFVNQGVTLQMLWFIHGILALANELGVEFRIVCRP